MVKYLHDYRGDHIKGVGARDFSGTYDDGATDDADSHYTGRKNIKLKDTRKNKKFNDFDVLPRNQKRNSKNFKSDLEQISDEKLDD